MTAATLAAVSARPAIRTPAGTGAARRRLRIPDSRCAAMESARLLSAAELAQAGLAGSHAGAPLLACEMPYERGGRLHRDVGSGPWRVSEGYERHPVYWVTWIGAAAFAAWEGARLPSRAELAKLTAPGTRPVLNAGYRFADVLPVAEPGLGADQIHHLIGNLQVWCGDGPGDDDLCCGPATRWLHGAAWNTPGTPQEIHRARWRHLAGSSRGIGIRLVRDGTRQPVSAGTLAERRDLLTSLAREQGTTVVLVTHDAQVAAYADRKVMVRDGLVLEDLQASR